MKYGNVSVIMPLWRVSLFFDIPFQEFCQETVGVAPPHVPELACVRIPGNTSFSCHQLSSGTNLLSLSPNWMRNFYFF